MGAEIDRLEIAVETEAIKANQQLDMMIEKLNKVNKSLSGIDLNKLRGVSDSVKSTGKSAQDSANKAKYFSSAMSTLAIHTGSSNSQLKKFTSTLGSYVAKTTLATKKSKGLSQTIGSFYASFFPVIRGVKALGKSIESSMDYIETFNYFNVTMDKIGKEFSNQYKRYGYDSASGYADSFSSRLNDLTEKMTGYKIGDNGMLSITGDKSLGLDPNQIMNYQASIAAVTNSVGLCGETSVNTSKALSMLAADMSSFKNVDLQTVMTNMQSGLIGQSRALYKYGIDITNATLQTYAYKYGLSTAVSEMTQADKMQLRLLAILDQSKIAWGDLANTVGSVSNQYRILKQQIQNVARAIGFIFIPIVQAILPVVNGVMIAMNRLFGFIGPLIYGTERWKKIMDGISSGYSGLDTGDIADDTVDMANNSGDVADNLGKAKKNAKDLKNAMLGIDELNVIQPEDDSDSASGSSGTGVGTGGAGGIDLSNEISAALADYEAVWNKAFKNSVNKAQQYADKITKVFSNMWSLLKSGDYEGLGEYIAGGVDYVFEKINSVFNWQKMGSGITAFVDGYTRTINSLVTNIHWKDIGNTIGDGINVITNTMYLYLTGIDWVNLGLAFANGVNGIIDSVDWQMLGQTIGAWFMKIPKIVYGFVTNLNWDEIGVAIGNSINGFFMEFDGKTIAGGINGLVNGVLTTLKEAIKTVDWSEVAKAVGDVLGNLDWGALAKVGLAVGAMKLAGALGNLFGSVLSEKIKNIFGGMFENAFKGIETKLGVLKSGISGLFADGAIFGSIPTGGLVAIGAGLATLVTGLAAVFATNEEVRQSFSDAVSSITDNFQPAIEFVSKTIIPDLENAWQGFIDIIKPFGDFLNTVFTDVWQKMINPALKYLGETVLPNVISTFQNLWKNVLVPLGELIGSILTPIIEIISSVLKTLWKNIVLPLADVIGGVLSHAFNGIVSILNSTVIPVIKTVISVFKFLWNKVLSPIVSFLKSTFGPVFKDIFGVVKGLINGLGDAFEWVIDKINSALDVLKTAVNGIIGAINWVTNALGLGDVLEPWSGIKLAGGTDGLKSDTLAVVNDQKGATYKELVMFPNGKSFIPEGRNVMLPLPKGTKVMPAGQTKDFMKGFPHFKGGIGDFFGGLWESAKNIAGSIWDYATHPDKILQIAINKFVDISSMLEPWSTIAGGVVKKVFGSAVKFIKKMFDKAIPEVDYVASAGVEQWRKLAEKALRMTNQFSESNLTRLLYQMQTESGGNPRAINNWDINAKNGTPSKGLMQVIDPTFKTWAMPPYDKDIYDPLSNMIASIRYAVNRYGSLAKAYSGHGYADGGFPKVGEYFYARENGPELVGRVGSRNAVMNNDQIVSSVSAGVESAIRQQNAETNALLRQIIDYQEKLLRKDNSVNIDGKKADKQLSKARSNAGYCFT